MALFAGAPIRALGDPNMMFFRLALLVLLFAPGAMAQTSSENWLTDSRTGCKVVRAYKANSPNVAWSGGCTEGLASGKGTARWTSETGRIDQYEGEMRGGRKNGHGIYLFISGSPYAGDRYEGGFADDEYEGRGVYLWKSGSRYEGQVSKGFFSGQGTMTWPNGDRYVGQWSNDIANGQGTKTLPDGRTYTGVWTNGCFRQGDRWATVGASAEKCGFK
jgi:hypothetical protein